MPTFHAIDYVAFALGLLVSTLIGGYHTWKKHRKIQKCKKANELKEKEGLQGSQLL